MEIGFRPIQQPHEHWREPHSSMAASQSSDDMMEVSACLGGSATTGTCGQYANSNSAWGSPSGDELCSEENETLPDTMGFSRLNNEDAYDDVPAFLPAFHGSTLRELCHRYAEDGSATQGHLWEEVVDGLRVKEGTRERWRLDPSTARHMKYRPTLIEWVLEVCADFNFGPTTADLAVHYMDRVLSKVNVPKTSLQLVAMCCLEVAVKYEEVEENVPSLPRLRKCASNVYSVDIIKKMELAVLVELEWDLSVIVPAHFLEAFMAITGGGTTPHDDVGDRRWTPAYLHQLRKLVCYLHSLCLQDAHISSRTSASMLAAGILGAARVQLGICPIWPVEMQVATSYSSEDLAPTMSRVLQLYKESLPHDPQEAMGSMMDVVVHNLEHGEKFAEGSREMLTPSPTGPLENGWMSMCD